MESISSLLADYGADIPLAFWTNIRLAFLATLGSFVLGVVLALFRISPVPSLRALGTGYVNVVRNTPLTIIMLLGVLAVWGQLKISFSSDFTLNFFIYAVIALSLYHAAFMCEAIRSGVNTVPLGQAEAARSIGLGFLPAARHVILPQALRGAITPLGNTVIALTKNTTVAAAASVAEASGLMKRMIEFSPDVMVAIFLTFAIGFTIAYFLAFEVRSKAIQSVLFLICTIPFWTSNVIRMIAWVPLLGRNGLVEIDTERGGLGLQRVEHVRQAARQRGAVVDGQLASDGLRRQAVAQGGQEEHRPDHQFLFIAPERRPR